MLGQPYWESRVFMTDLKNQTSKEAQLHKNQLSQEVKGSKYLSNYVIASMTTIGAIGFGLASISSYLGKNFLPLGNPASLIFVPQGLVMGIYAFVAMLLAIYLWTLIIINYGSGYNKFNKETGLLSIYRKGLFRKVSLEIPLENIQAVKLEVRDGINPTRRISLKVKGRKDLPLTKVGQPIPLAELEQEGAELASFLKVNLEGI